MELKMTHAGGRTAQCERSKVVEALFGRWPHRPEVSCRCSPSAALALIQAADVATGALSLFAARFELAWSAALARSPHRIVTTTDEFAVMVLS